MAKNALMASTAKFTPPGKGATVMLIDPRLIVPAADYNVRDTFDSVNDEQDKELKASMKAHGWLARYPGIVTPPVNGKYLLLVANRRFAAMSELMAEGMEFKTVPMLLEEKGATDAERFLDLILSNSGKQLSQAERGTVFLRLRGTGWKDTEIAEKAGITVKSVQSMITFARADKRLLALVKKGVVSETLAMELAAAHGSTVAAEIVTDALETAPLTGAKAGKVTTANIGRSERKKGGATKVASKAKGNRKTVKKTPVSIPDAGGTAVESEARGPWKVTGDGDIRDSADDVIGYGENAAQAAMMVRYLNQGWQTLKGKIVAPVAPATPPVKAPAMRKARGK